MAHPEVSYASLGAPHQLGCIAYLLATRSDVEERFQAYADEEQYVDVERNLLMRDVVFELCAESVDACVAAGNGGADRIELCSALSEGGLSPSHGLIQEALRLSTVPVHMMLRPRGGNFVYSDVEFSVMREDIAHGLKLGVHGFVLGILRSDRTVDIERTQELVAMAAPFEVTFHRAFDDTPNLFQALEDVIASGCRRILTSGGEADVVAGTDVLAALVKQASGRVKIVAGGGLRLENATQLARMTGTAHFHGSLRRVIPGTSPSGGIHQQAEYFVESDDVRDVIRTLRTA